MSWLRLARVVQRVERRLEEDCRLQGLSMAQSDVLAHVGAAEGMTQQQLADSLLVTKGNVCQLLDRMERLELLQRRQEGRANRLYLTPQGRALFDEVVPGHEASLHVIFDVLSVEEQRHLLWLLKRLDRSLA
ncbi:MAG: MarR family winged helix-turn-helix transcriptional regulator [Chloroflexota bacterium]